MNNDFKFKQALAVVVLAGVAENAYGHHSTAAFDYSRTVTLSGMVREFQWSNPHCYIQLLVPDDSGVTVEWSIEGGTPASMSGMGWTKRSLSPGDKVTISFAPLRTGSHSGTVKTVTLADGKTLSGMGAVLSGDGGKPSAGPQLPDLERATPKP